jgi:putative intracellular protease/amidase
VTRVVAVLVFDQVKLLDIAGPVEVFVEAIAVTDVSSASFRLS